MDGTAETLRGRRVLVTGASGFIGRALVAALSKAGATITVTSRTRHSIAGLGGMTPRVMRGDLADPRKAAEAVAGQEVIVNLAYDVRASAQANIAALDNLLTAAAGAGCERIIHASSIVVYDDWPNGSLSETSPMRRPGGGYRHAKIAMEQRLMAGPLPVAILQPTLVYGPGSRLWTDGFAEALLRGAVVLPEPQGRCQGIFVEDVVQGFLRAAIVPDLGHERFILNGPAPFLWSDLMTGYRDILGRGEVLFRAAAELAPANDRASGHDTDHAPSAAARISAFGRSVLGHDRFERLVRSVRRHAKGKGEMRPDAHLFHLMVAQGACPPMAARQRLGFAPRYDLASGLAATADYLRGLAS